MRTCTRATSFSQGQISELQGLDNEEGWICSITRDSAAAAAAEAEVDTDANADTAISTLTPTDRRTDTGVESNGDADTGNGDAHTPKRIALATEKAGGQAISLTLRLILGAAT